VRVVAVAWKLSTIEGRLLGTKLLVSDRITETKVTASTNTWVRFPTKVFSVDQKLSTTEDRCQGKRCLFVSVRNLQEQRPLCDKSVLGLIPSDYFFCRLGTM
jgi:hypothetical protein